MSGTPSSKIRISELKGNVRCHRGVDRTVVGLWLRPDAHLPPEEVEHAEVEPSWDVSDAASPGPTADPAASGESATGPASAETRETPEAPEMPVLPSEASAPTSPAAPMEPRLLSAPIDSTSAAGTTAQSADPEWDRQAPSHPVPDRLPDHGCEWTEGA